MGMIAALAMMGAFSTSAHAIPIQATHATYRFPGYTGSSCYVALRASPRAKGIGMAQQKRASKKSQGISRHKKHTRG